MFPCWMLRESCGFIADLTVDANFKSTDLIEIHGFRPGNLQISMISTDSHSKSTDFIKIHGFSNQKYISGSECFSRDVAWPVFRLGLFAISCNIISWPWPAPYVRWHNVFKGNHRARARNVHDQFQTVIKYGLSKGQWNISRRIHAPYCAHVWFVDACNLNQRILHVVRPR